MDNFLEATKLIEKLDFHNDVKEEALKNLKHWITHEDLSQYRPYIDRLIQMGNGPALLDSFWRMMPFGTGGRRGPVGVGPNRFNPHTLSLSVQGHCRYLDELLGTGQKKVVVAYDVRRFDDLRGTYGKEPMDGVLLGLTSRDMARMAAMTYAANNVIAYVVGPLEDEPGQKTCLDKYISTPELSFLIRELDADGGLNVSASHNHPDDNGGKFYNKDGGQEVPPYDEKLLTVVQTITDVETMAYPEAREKNLIRIVPNELHERYIDINAELCLTDSRSARIGFSPLCGTGSTTVLEALKKLGFQVDVVAEQADFDGSFETVRYRIANPEVPESMDELKQMSIEKGCQIAFATDPDADRLGMLIPDGKGSMVPVNGNEIGIMLLQTILSERKKRSILTNNPIFINTMVTSSLQREIARRYGCQVVGDLMVGFKYMGDVLGHLEKEGRFPPAGGPKDRDVATGKLEDFIFTCEESHGYLLSHQVRDKDACGAAVHLSGMASIFKDTNKSFKGLMRDVYKTYGYYRNDLRSLVMEGIVGLERIAGIQQTLRANPPKEIGGMKVLNFVDNQKVGGPIKSSTDEASRNVLLYELDGGDGSVIRLVIRPSGTEPKTKIYVEVPSASPLKCNLDQATPEQLSTIDEHKLDEVIAKTDAKAVAVGNAFIMYCLGPDVLGDVYKEVPPESLLVSDLVPVDKKIALCTTILPGLIQKMNEASVGQWLDKELTIFGEQPRGLVAQAANAWLNRAAKEGRLDNSLLQTAKSLFE